MDVFLSYAREDCATAQSLADVLRARGRSVWMDSAVQAGEYWDATIEAALRESRCVIVLWSSASVQSHWVRSEAEQARQRGILVPARIASIDLPYGFTRLHTADLIEWRGRDDHRGLNELLAGVGRVLQLKAEASAPIRLKRNRLFWRVTLLVATVGMIAIAVLLTNSHRDWTSFTLDFTASGLAFIPEQSNEVSDLLVISEFAALDIEKLQVPRTKVTPDRTLNREPGRPGIVKLAHDESRRRGSITLAPIWIGGGSRVSILAGERKGSSAFGQIPKER